MLDPLPERSAAGWRQLAPLSPPPDIPGIEIASSVRHAFAIPRRTDLPAIKVPLDADRIARTGGFHGAQCDPGRYCPTCRRDLALARDRWCHACGTPVDPDDPTTFDAYPKPLISGATVLLVSTLTGWVTTIVALRDAILALDLEVIVREGLLGGGGLGLLLLIPFFCLATVVNEAHQALHVHR